MNQMDANAGGAGDGQASAMTQAAQEDAANIRKQAERDAAARLAEEKRRFLRDFLDVADNLEMALALGHWPGISEGVKLAFEHMLQVLARAGVQRMEVREGDTFDPAYHEAVEARTADVPHDTVVAVVRSGYLLDGQVLRPAQVVVARPAK